MTDIVVLLDEAATLPGSSSTVCADAADEIRRLRASSFSSEDVATNVSVAIAATTAEVARLRAALEEIKARYAEQYSAGAIARQALMPNKD